MHQRCWHAEEKQRSLSISVTSDRKMERETDRECQISSDAIVLQSCLVTKKKWAAEKMSACTSQSVFHHRPSDKLWVKTIMDSKLQAITIKVIKFQCYFLLLCSTFKHAFTSPQHTQFPKELTKTADCLTFKRKNKYINSVGALFIGLTAKVTSSRTTVPNLIHYIQSATLVSGN